MDETERDEEDVTEGEGTGEERQQNTRPINIHLGHKAHHNSNNKRSRKSMARAPEAIS